MRFKVVGKQPEKAEFSIAELVVDADDDGLCLYVEDELLLEITSEGYLKKYDFAQGVEGLQCDDKGHIKEIEA